MSFKNLNEKSLHSSKKITCIFFGYFLMEDLDISYKNLYEEILIKSKLEIR